MYNRIDVGGTERASDMNACDKSFFFVVQTHKPEHGVLCWGRNMQPMWLYTFIIKTSFLVDTIRTHPGAICLHAPCWSLCVSVCIIFSISRARISWNSIEMDIATDTRCRPGDMEIAHQNNILYFMNFIHRLDGADSLSYSICTKHLSEHVRQRVNETSRQRRRCITSYGHFVIVERILCSMHWHTHEHRHIQSHTRIPLVINSEIATEYNVPVLNNIIIRCARMKQQQQYQQCQLPAIHI